MRWPQGAGIKAYGAKLMIPVVLVVRIVSAAEGMVLDYTFFRAPVLRISTENLESKCTDGNLYLVFPHLIISMNTGIKASAIMTH